MKWIFASIFLWLSFVVSLASWWLYFGINTLSSVSDASNQVQLVRHQRMLFMEGCVLLIFLVSGGLALFYFSYRMYKEKSAKEIFFASFAHDIKTTLFRLQLEVEKLGHGELGDQVIPILNQTRTMQIDLENSLDSVVGPQKQIYIEEINLKTFLQDLHAQWPEFHIKFTGGESLKADRKALHSIFKNLLHNSFVHGQADEVSVELVRQGNKNILNYTDNGSTFVGDLRKLGKVYQFTPGGSGFGLFIVRQWVQRLGGQVRFTQGPAKALEIFIELPRGGNENFIG